MARICRITVVVENTSPDGSLLAQHGLAVWIELGGRRVLFDTGQAGALVGNAYRLSVPLRQLDALVLSHGHYDHTGGVAEVLRPARPTPIYAHPAALEPKFARNRDGSAREIGIPYDSLRMIRNQRKFFVKTDKPARSIDGLTVTGPIPRTTDFEDTGGPFFADPRCRVPDPLTDDQAVFFEALEGTVVILGCAHAGVINTLRHIRQLTGERPIHAVLGGMHLVQASKDRIERTIDELRRLDVGRIGPAHCTGEKATAALRRAFPERFLPCHAGSRFEFEVPDEQSNGE
jgi:7,8-dihydropterin-6-yl-methyl-4-(beta-D-ribofuranosyl)aminobenzene 5'-phosphate synthase